MYTLHKRMLTMSLGVLLMVGIMMPSGFSQAAGTGQFTGVGRDATPKEIAAWDIEVRPDFRGLPKGSGSVTKGAEVWDGKCASCHGSFGESNQVFTPIVGGTTKEDIKTGRVAALVGNSQPQRTTMMKLSQVSSLWDFINRAMPWNAPKTLSTEEVYAVTAYILNMAEVVPDDFVLSNDNIADVQKRLPNRNGMQMNHGLWNAKGQADVHNIACMKDCAADVAISSSMPEYARNAHGNLALQNRIIGSVRGTDTTQSARANLTNITADASSVALPQAVQQTKGGAALIKQYGCTACHSVANKIVGPAFLDVHKKYADAQDAEAMLVAKVKNGGQGAWGSIPMPSNQAVPEDDLKQIVKWILAGAH